MLFLALLLILSALTIVILRSKKPKNVVPNKYIADHEEKLIDDNDYEDYIEWCKIKGEIASQREGFDLQRVEEYHLYKKLMKHGIKGL